MIESNASNLFFIYVYKKYIINYKIEIQQYKKRLLHYIQTIKTCIYDVLKELLIPSLTKIKWDNSSLKIHYKTTNMSAIIQKYIITCIFN